MKRNDPLAHLEQALYYNSILILFLQKRILSTQLQYLLSLFLFVSRMKSIVTTVTHSLSVIEFILMDALGGHLVSSIDMITIIAHASCVMLRVYMFAVAHLLRYSPPF